MLTLPAVDEEEGAAVGDATGTGRAAAGVIRAETAAPAERLRSWEK